MALSTWAHLSDDDFDDDDDDDRESNELVEITVDVLKHQTDKAGLFVIGGEEYWLPWSQIDDDSDVEKTGDSGTIWIPQWLAEEKGLIDA